MNQAYWSAKIQGNCARDVRHTRTLEEEGYTVLRFWEHELAEAPARCVERIEETLLKTAEGLDEADATRIREVATQ